MNISSLLALANVTPDESAEIDTPIGKVEYARVGTVVIRSMEETVRADDGADVFVHEHEDAGIAHECYSAMVGELQAMVNGYAMDSFADALARTATVPQGWDSV